MSEAGGASAEGPPRPPQETPSGPPAEEKRVKVVPIDPAGTSERERGKIEYTYNTPSEPAGVFSFAYYYRPSPTGANRDVMYREVAMKYYRYLFGMTKYIGLIDTEEAFRGWKLVLYTDNATLAAISSLPSQESDDARPTAEALMAHPNFILARCEWPEYSQVQTRESIDGVILRVLRHKAMMDFPSIPVLVRDADTYFDHEIYHRNFPELLGRWESLLLLKQRETGKPFLVAGTPGYERDWHHNRLHDVSMSGLLAGLVNKTGEIPEWTSGQLWQDSLSFIRGRCYIDTGTHALSNLEEGTYVGKDEQIIIFIWIPALLERTFFFHFDYHARGGESGHYLTNWEYPGNIYHSVYQQLVREFPQYVVAKTGKLHYRTAESAYSKMSGIWLRAHDSVAPGSPLPGERYESPTYSVEEFREIMRNILRRLIRQGMYVEADAEIVDQLHLTYDMPLGRMETFCVTYPFDNPFYQRHQYLMWQKHAESYEIVCKRVAANAPLAPGGGAAGGAAGGSAGGNVGGRRRRRTIKKSRKIRNRRSRTYHRRR